MITKGPWEPIINHARGKRYSKTLIYQNTGRLENRFIADCFNDSLDIPEMEANAQAISAVPDMIRALKEVALFGFTYCIDADADRYRVSIPIETRDKITAALEKAGVKP
jgi:hypothetical protein